MQAKYLQRGDKLVTVNGEKKIALFIEHVIYEQPIAVYNFEVEGNHNYFVGHESRVLAHNVCGGFDKIDDIERNLNNVDDYISKGEKYNNFTAFKKAKGRIHDKEWHHIVEQNQIRKSNFTNDQIQNTNNLIQIPKKSHREISGYYSSKVDKRGGKQGLNVRNWLAGKSFKQQYKIGIKILKELKII